MTVDPWIHDRGRAGSANTYEGNCRMEGYARLSRAAASLSSLLDVSSTA